MTLARRQFFHGFRQRKVLNPVHVGVFGVLHLIHDIQRVAVIMIDRFKQGNRLLNRLQCQHDVLTVDIHSFRDFLHARFSLQAAGKLFLGLQCFVRQIPHGAGNPNRIVVSEIAANLADDHRYRVSRKLHAMTQIKIVEGLDQSDTANLKQIIRIFSAVGESLDHAEYQSEISLNKLVACLLISRLNFFDHLHHFRFFVERQFRGIHTADFHFVHHCHTDPHSQFDARRPCTRYAYRVRGLSCICNV